MMSPLEATVISVLIILVVIIFIILLVLTLAPPQSALATGKASMYRQAFGTGMANQSGYYLTDASNSIDSTSITQKCVDVLGTAGQDCGNSYPTNAAPCNNAFSSLEGASDIATAYANAVTTCNTAYPGKATPCISILNIVRDACS
jgi:type II secretory pathway pseudopilin PulG